MAEQQAMDGGRAEAFDAALNLREGEQSLASALDAIREDAERAAGAYRAVVRSLAMALSARDGYTGAHSDIVHDLAVEVAVRLDLSPQEVDEVKVVALLHDIGKIGIPDEVLHKSTPLTEEEWSLMRSHPAIGERILGPLPGFERVASAVRHEHERWDGCGYPDGLAGKSIPLASRIVLACDAFHALVSDRPYRPALELEAAVTELNACSGTQFDPEVIGALLEAIRDDEFGTLSSGHTAESDSSRGATTLDRGVKALLTIASAAVSAETLEGLLEVAAGEALSAVDACSVSISRCEAQSRRLRVLVNAGDLAEWEERRPTGETYRLDDDERVRDLILNGASYVASLEDPDTPEPAKRLLRSLGKQSYAAVPVMTGTIAWGELIATRKAGRPVFGDRELRLLQTIASQIATAASRMQVFAQMADLAFRDSLTGVGNRRAFDERLELAATEALEAERPLCLVLCDLDNLRDLNEAGGHQAGDDALRRVAAALVGVAGEVPVYRLGGDEFALILDGETLETGYGLGARMLEAMPLGLTISCGVAALAANARSADLLRAADQALYVAKRSGRGRVCVASSDAAWAWPERDLEQGQTRRRGQRRRIEVDRLLDRTLAALDGPLRDASVFERLEAVVSLAAAALGLARAAVSHSVTGSGTVEAVISIDYRSGRTWAYTFGEAPDLYHLAEYPQTAAVMTSGGSFYVDVASPDAHPSEVALLRDWGLTTMVAAAACHGDSGWLVELYADGQTAALDRAQAAIRLLVAEAVASASSSAEVGASDTRAA
jgi:diguanylate cyclase (GGDEF)-like protein